jgi:repressor LexA
MRFVLEVLTWARITIIQAAGGSMGGTSGDGGTLTARQREVLEAIGDFEVSHGYAPTLREIGKAVGLASLSSVSHQLSALQEKGHLSRDPGLPRTAVVRQPGQQDSRPGEPGVPSAAGGGEAGGPPAGTGEAAYIPVVGRIAAGGPRYAEQSVEDIFPLPRQLVGDGTLFMLKVTGDSMINAAITDGDWVVVREQPKAENGEIVAAMIDGEATVKTFKLSGSHAWLMPHNPVYPPIPGDDARILGKVVAVLRRV